MLMCGGRFFFLLAQHTHETTAISRPNATTPITTPATMPATGPDPSSLLLLLLGLLLEPPLAEDADSPPRLGAGGSGTALDGTAGDEPPSSGGTGGEPPFS
jgi:hypothetical protein